MALHSQCGKAGSHHEPPIGYRRGVQQLGYPAAGLHRRVYRDEGGGPGKRNPPPPEGQARTVAYDQLRMWVDKEKTLPTKIECLTEAAMLIKTLYFKDMKDFGGGIVRPAVVETDSPLYKGYRSYMIFAKVKAREIPDEAFTLNFMPRLESLR